MTIPFRNARRVVTNSGAVASIALDFRAENAADVHLYAALPGVYEMVLGVDYMVSGLNTDELTATIINPAGWGAFAQFALLVEYVVDQPNDVDVGGPFGLRFENALDRIMLTIQSMYDKVERSVKMPVNGPVDADNSLTPDPDQLIGWNAAGTALESKPQISQSIEDAQVAAAASAASAALSATNLVLAQQAVVDAAAQVALANTAVDDAEAAAALALANAISGTGTAINNASAIASASVADGDKLGLYDVSAASLVSLTIANLVAAIFKVARIIPAAQFAAATFKLFNAAGTPRALTFDTTALTADRSLAMPNRDIDLNNMTRRFVSAPISPIATSSLQTVAHGLGVIPDRVDLYLRCLVADGGWAVGDTIQYHYDYGGLNMTGAIAYSDATNVYVRTGNGTIGTVPRKDTGVVVNLIAGNWAMIVKAYTFGD